MGQAAMSLVNWLALVRVVVAVACHAVAAHGVAVAGKSHCH